MEFLKNYTVKIKEKTPTAFKQEIDVYQDGTTPLCRDKDGKLWAISGHSHCGHVGMFSGTCVADLKEVYKINTNFCVGHADFAFAGVRYPEGIKARGSVWPFGLYICPNTNRFFCFFHNESGWRCRGTAYDALGPCESPHFDSDFRHIGLMHSDDQGRTWTFDRWVLSANEPALTEYYNPAGDLLVGQKKGSIKLGSGDFSIFVEPDGEYIYLTYNIVRVNTETQSWEGCDVYIARTRKRTDGVMGDFVKYYQGSFGEAGNFGKETVLFERSWHPRIAYLKKYGTYIMTSSRMQPHSEISKVIEDVLEIRESKDLIHWSEPVSVIYEGKEFGNHYVAIVSDDNHSHPGVIEGDDFAILSNHNGTDVIRYVCSWEKK